MTTTNPTSTRDHVDHKKMGYGLVTKDESSSGTKSVSMWISIDDIDCNYNDNVRFPPYTYKGNPCSFREEDVLDLLETLPMEQHQPILVAVNPASRRHEVDDGFRRYFAMSLLRDRGIECAHGYALLCTKVPKLKSAQDHADALNRHGAMQSLKPFTPIDLAHYAEHLVSPLSKNGCGLTEDEARRRLCAMMQHNPHFRVDATATEITAQQFQKLRRLTSLKADTKLAVHEGRLPWTSALSAASKRGEGNVRGPSGPQAPRGFKPSEAVSLATSEAFAGEVPEMVPREQVIALLHYMGNAEATPPPWLERAKLAARKVDSAAKEAAGTKKKTPPRKGAALSVVPAAE